MRIALGQINPTVGDLRGNGLKIVDFSFEADRRGADLVVFPELCITGYPPLDLLEQPAFLDDVERTVASVAESVPSGIGVVIGAPLRNQHPTGKRLFNAAVFLEGGRTVAQIRKSLLPTYEVYDEYRYFEPAIERRCVEWRGLRLGIHICEDMWNSDTSADSRLYDVDPVEDLARDGADLFINLSASPFSAGQRQRRSAEIERICSRFGRPFVTVSQVGASSELIFDGDSRVHWSDGRVAACAPGFEESLLLWDTSDRGCASIRKRDDAADIFQALVLGIRDYYRKSASFSGVLVGLSGGIDSAVTAALAVEAVGADSVLTLMLPSKYTPAPSIEDARAVAGRLGVTYREIPIDRSFDELMSTIDEKLGADDGGVTIVEENLQARVRAVVLMGVSNQSDRLVLATGNKSEAAVGYTTLYGDMTGGLGVLSDVYKSQVYELARHINMRSGGKVIPDRVLAKPPSAELRPGQRDQDALPPYEQLDAILSRYVEDRQDVDAIVAETDFGRELVLSVLQRVDAAEFKRRQAPPGLRVSRRAFVIGHRMPIIPRWERYVPKIPPRNPDD